MTQPLASADPTRVISVAGSWLGTPYHDQASLRGVGCDCLGLARGVWREVVGPEPFPIPPYSRDWGETGPREVLAEGARRMMIEVPPAEVAERAEDVGPDVDAHVCRVRRVEVENPTSTLTGRRPQVTARPTGCPASRLGFDR